MAQVKGVLGRQQCCSSPSNNSLSMLNLLIILLFYFTVFCTGLLLSGCNFVQILWIFHAVLQIAKTEQQERKIH